MDKHDIEPGKHYAIREHPTDDLQHVKILESVRSGKWRAEWIDPNPGLVDYVSSRHIIVPWGQRRALLRDERNADAMTAAVDRSGFPGNHHPVAIAVTEILDSTGERDISVHHGVLSYEPDVLERVAARANIDIPDHVVGYRDRHGRHHLPWDCAIALAAAFACNEPSTVLDPIDAKEHEWSTEARRPGGHYLIDLLTEYRAVWAIVRQWAGHDAAIAAREERIRDLEQLVTSVMWDLRRTDPDCDGSLRESNAPSLDDDLAPV